MLYKLKDLKKKRKTKKANLKTKHWKSERF